MLDPHSYGGIYVGREPVLFVRDPKIIGHVTVKDFSHFRDRINALQMFKDSIAKHLFNVSGDLWRALRLNFTPTFTSGKLKNMFAHFQKCSDQLDTVFDQMAGDCAEVDIKDMMARFTTDIISSCAFGLDINSISDPNNKVRKLIKSTMFLPLALSTKVAMAFLNIFPGLRGILKMNLHNPIAAKFITKVVTETIEFREKKKVTRNDFLDLVIELKSSSTLNKKCDPDDLDKAEEKTFEMTMDLLIAQCFLFFIAGFETSSSVMSYCLYELALNSEIQRRLRSEIDDVTKKHGGLTYDAIKDMAFLDQTVSETMRKYPTVPFLNRTCTKGYRMPDSGIVIKEGTLLVIPVYALHHDPKYFPNPEVFDPDRFSSERRSSIPPYAYLPFGEGPRNCIGMRFGLLQTKLGICTILLKYELLKTSKTQVPLEFVPSMLVTTTKGPIYLRIKHRSEH